MATQPVKLKNDAGSSAIAGAASGISERISGRITDAREFLHDVRVEARQVTWPSREDVVATTGVVIATVCFFGIFLTAIDWLVQRGVTYIFKVFGV